MKRVTHDPLSAVKSMLNSCRNDEIDFFFIDSASGKSICVYPTSDDAFAARHAVQIGNADRALVQAGLIGLVHLHNRPYAREIARAAEAFVRNCKADFYFGYGDGA
jgi:hypothetical protein